MSKRADKGASKVQKKQMFSDSSSDSDSDASDVSDFAKLAEKLNP